MKITKVKAFFPQDCWCGFHVGPRRLRWCM